MSVRRRGLLHSSGTGMMPQTRRWLPRGASPHSVQKQMEGERSRSSGRPLLERTPLLAPKQFVSPRGLRGRLRHSAQQLETFWREMLPFGWDGSKPALVSHVRLKGEPALLPFLRKDRQYTRELGTRVPDLPALPGSIGELCVGHEARGSGRPHTSQSVSLIAKVPSLPADFGCEPHHKRHSLCRAAVR
jgi:hypothetical protein